ncbi:MAG: hypothetical protein R2755_10715 [Acidimicrobiales bacterium]
MRVRPVLVAAPTLGLRDGDRRGRSTGRCWPAAGLLHHPIKALSNQKYGDLARLHGGDAVRLLYSGSSTVNAEAPVVVMTTEVLRNMIYAGTSLERLAYAVLDEVHYLQDAYRGPVAGGDHLPAT